MFERKRESGHGESFSSPEEVKGYAEHMEKVSSRLYRGFLRACKSMNPGGRFLEVGAGTGILTCKIAAMFPSAQITALELSPEMADYGREYVRKNGFDDRVEYIVGDAENRGFMSTLQGYDFVYSSLTLHHFEDAERAIGVLYDTVAENGTLAIFDLRRVWWLYWVPSSDGFFVSIRASYKLWEISNMLKRHGFSQFEVKHVFPFMLLATIRR